MLIEILRYFYLFREENQKFKDFKLNFFFFSWVLLDLSNYKDLKER